MGVTVVKNKDTIIPEAYLRLVLANNDNCAGFAFVEGGEIMQMAQPTSADVKGITDAQTEYKDKQILFYFGDGNNNLAEEDLQPYKVCTNDTGQLIVVAVAHGNFPGYIKDKSSHPAEYHLMTEYLGPKVSKLAKLLKYNVDELTDELGDDTFKTEVDNTYTKDASILFMTAAGSCIKFGDIPAKEFPWGFTTNSYDYEKGADRAPAASGAAPAAGKKLMSLSAPAPDKEADPPFVPDKKDEKLPDGVHQVPGTDTRIPDKAGLPHEIWVSPPVTLHKTKNPLKNWYNRWLGRCPQNFQRDLPKVRLVGETVKKWYAEHPDHNPLGNDAPANVEVFKKDVEPNTVGDKSQQPVVEGVQLDRSPLLLSVEKRKSFLEGFMKDSHVIRAIDRHNAEMKTNPAGIQKVEALIPSFEKDTGYTLAEVTTWPLDVKLDLVKNCPEVATLLIRNLEAAVKSARGKTAEVLAKYRTEETGEKQGPTNAPQNNPNQGKKKLMSLAS